MEILMPEKIKLGEKHFTLLPIPAIGLRAMGDNLASLGSLDASGIEALVSAIYYGVLRGMPDDCRKDFSREFVEWNIGVDNLQDLMEQVAKVNTLQRRDSSGGNRPGEDAAAVLTGTTPSPTSVNA